MFPEIAHWPSQNHSHFQTLASLSIAACHLSHHDDFLHRVDNLRYLHDRKNLRDLHDNYSADYLVHSSPDESHQHLGNFVALEFKYLTVWKQLHKMFEIV